MTIYTLGRFSLLLNGQRVDFGRKMPHRPLELLKTLIALGGREIPVTTLTTVMWPDADGDTAQRSFDTTLHRLRRLLALGRYWESHGLWEKAMHCYQKGLEVDDLIEVFYQRLMVCCLETRRFSEGMSVYRRCRQVLSIVFGLQPEAATESHYQQLEYARNP